MIKNCSELLNEVNKYNDFDEFKTHAGYFDIETTGLSPESDKITIAGIYSKNMPRYYIHGIDIEKAALDVMNHRYIVSYNGENFDLKFMERFNDFKRSFVSIDIMYILRELGYRGGLKKIEKDLGIIRDGEVLEMQGKDAVKLWNDYINGDKSALTKIIKYNTEDIVNLEVLLNFSYYKALGYPVLESTIKHWKEELNSKICY